MNALRKCRQCGLEANTKEELDLFIRGSHSKPHNRVNLCKQCFSDRVKKRRSENDRCYLKYKFQSIKTRCYNQKDKSYEYYGDRGITICEDWLKNPESFVDWALNSGWKRGLEIDRINTDGQYSPENCRWSTRKDQQRNRRHNTTFPEKGTRICSRCKIEKSLTKFHKDRYNPHGHIYVCKKCRNKK